MGSNPTGGTSTADRYDCGSFPAEEAATPSGREEAKLHERLMRVQSRLRSVRTNRRVLDEQVAHLRAVADDAETRRLVASTPLADREWQRARTDLDRHGALLAEADRELDALLEERDRLLDRLLELSGSVRGTDRRSTTA